MTNDERKKFWETLCSLPGEDAEKELSQINDTIILPPAIYRYRKSADEKTINALETNRMFFSTADHYDDPFDTYINIDFEYIKAQIVEGTADQDTLVARFKERWTFYGCPLPNDEVLEAVTKSLCENTDKYLDFFFHFLQQNIQVAFQQRIYSVCFCESPINPSAWIKYGNESHGFCLMYSLKESEKSRLKCGSEAICKYCNVKKYGLELFPVCYAEDKYDATAVAHEIIHGYIQCLLKGVPSLSIRDFTQWWDFPKWSLERVALIKAIEHEHDKEWRLLFTGHTANRIQCEWIPSAVIFGLRMSDGDRAKVKAAAKKAGIPKCYSVIINWKNELELKEDHDYICISTESEDDLCSTN